MLGNLWIGAEVVSVSDSYLRGDDGNDQPALSGYTLLNLTLRWQPVKHLELWGRVDNVTNAEYATAGARNWNAFPQRASPSGDEPIGIQRFVAPGAPIAGWAGVKVRF